MQVTTSKKSKIAIGRTLAVSLITNVILVSVLTGTIPQEQNSLNSTRTSSQAKPNSTSIAPNRTSSQAKPDSTCPGNGTRFDLGENLWADICYSKSIPAWILDIRFFFNGKPSIRGVPLTKKQWLALDKNRDLIFYGLLLSTQASMQANTRIP